MSRTYAKSPEVKSERVPHSRNLADITGGQLQSNFKPCSSDVNFNYFFSPILVKYRALEPACQTIGKSSILYDQRTAVSCTTHDVPNAEFADRVRSWWYFWWWEIQITTFAIILQYDKIEKLDSYHAKPEQSIFNL